MHLFDTDSRPSKYLWFPLLLIPYTVEPLLSGHPRGMARWPLNRGGRLIEVCQVWTRVWSTSMVKHL